MNPAPAPTPPQPHAPPRPPPAGRVLVLDDDPAGRRLLELVLSHRGWQVLLAASVAEARTRLQGPAAGGDPHGVPGGVPDLVLLDLRLPGEDGVALLQWMRAQPALAAVPAICVSASIAPGERSRMLAAGFDAFVPKPISPPQDLLDTMARVLAARRAAPAPGAAP